MEGRQNTETTQSRRHLGGTSNSMQPAVNRGPLTEDTGAGKAGSGWQEGGCRGGFHQG